MKTGKPKTQKEAILLVDGRMGKEGASRPSKSGTM